MVVQPRLFKNPNFLPISFMNWEKLGSMHSPRPTFQYRNFEYIDELGKVMFSNLSFTVENKMKISHKKEDGHILHLT